MWIKWLNKANKRRYLQQTQIHASCPHIALCGNGFQKQQHHQDASREMYHQAARLWFPLKHEIDF
jgi:hypothetical protein